MSSTGQITCGTGENNSGIGTSAWANPGNITADDSNYAIAQPNASQYLVARNFGFSIPAGATINGVSVVVNASEHSGGTEALLAQLQDATGALIGTAKTGSNEGNISGTTKANYTYGGTADVWGASLTQAIVTDPDFGVRFWFTTAHNIEVDFVTMAIEYTTGETYTKVQSDALAVADEQQRSMLTSRLLSDTLLLDDERLRSTLSSRLLDDALALSDLNEGYKVIMREVADALDVHDSGVERIWEISDDDRLDLTDALLRFYLRGRTLDDAITVIDSYIKQVIAEGQIFVRLREDTLEVIDQHLHVLLRFRLRDDSIEIDDELLASAWRGRVASDALEVSDNLQFTSLRTRLLQDAISVSDQASAERLLLRALDDTLEVVDEFIKQVSGGAILLREVSDGLEISDAFTHRLWLNRRLDDGIEVLDGYLKTIISEGAILERDSIDTLAVSDQVLLTRNYGRLASDGLEASDAVLRMLIRLREVADEFDVFDNTLTARISTRSIADLLDVTDAFDWSISGPSMLVDVCVMLGVQPDGVMQLGIDRVARLGLETSGVLLGLEQLVRLAVDQPRITLGAYN